LSSAVFYLDESGDLGWTLDSPYREGGSSNYLTIAALGVASEKRHFPKRLIRKLYKKHSWDTAVEKKWHDMKEPERVSFAEQARKLAERLPEVKYFSITVQKKNVQPHIQEDPNKLYNYMIRLLLIEEIAKHETVTLVPDERAIKVESGRSLHDYLQTQLWFDIGVTTKLYTTPRSSSSTLNLQFADMLAGVVRSHYEDGRSDPWKALRPCVASKPLFFK